MATPFGGGSVARGDVIDGEEIEASFEASFAAVTPGPRTGRVGMGLGAEPVGGGATRGAGTGADATPCFAASACAAGVSSCANTGAAGTAASNARTTKEWRTKWNMWTSARSGAAFAAARTCYGCFTVVQPTRAESRDGGVPS